MNYEMKTRKSREAHAASCLKLSESLTASFLIMLTISPMAMIVAQMFNGSVEHAGWSNFIKVMSGWQGMTFIVLEATVIGIATWARRAAYGIYDSLYPDKLSSQET